MTALLRWLALLLLALLALQLFFVLRIAAMAVLDPQSTAFQRSEAWRIQREQDRLQWRQQWVAYGQISDNLKRAVIASEDDGFSNHDGVDWDALETLLSKQRILEIYLNSVEWGEGVFGAEAAAQRYFRKPAAKLTALEAARLAVMLPRPRYFEKLPNSGYLAERAGVIVERLPNAQLP